MTKRIRFVEDALYETEGYQQGVTYKEGSTHDFEDHFADRWLRRGKAVEVNTREPLADDAPAEEIPTSAPETPEIDPLDHDGDGTRGGSLKGEQATASKGRKKAG